MRLIHYLRAYATTATSHERSSRSSFQAIRGINAGALAVEPVMNPTELKQAREIFPLLHAGFIGVLLARF